LAEVRVGRFRPRPKAGTLKRAGEIILAGLERQAKAGLGPAKRGGQITLHSPNVERLWKDVQIHDDGGIEFKSSLAFLLTQYGADDLRGGFREEVEAELGRLFQAGFDWVEEGA
jgi:hypothetical protein